MYTEQPIKDSIRLIARPTSFSEDGAVLRIGAQLFMLNEEQMYKPLSAFDPKDSAPSYYEEFASRGEFLALGSRAHTAAKLAEYLDVEGFGEHFMRLERWASPQQTGSYEDFNDKTKEERPFNASWDSSSEYDSEQEGYETWSEGSTINDEDLDSELDEDNDATSDLGENELALSESSLSDPEPESDCFGDGDDLSDSSKESDQQDDGQEAGSDASEGLSRPRSEIFDLNDQDSDDEGGVLGLPVDAHKDPFSYGRHVIKHGASEPERQPEMVFTVFQNGAQGDPKKVFQYSHRLSFMLYASPPAFHPTKPLVVWPLGAGDILFVDFDARTYFVQNMRASALQTRHISVKLHFSFCGNYLHIASFEAQMGGSQPEPDQLLPPLRIYLLLSTYRLSVRKTTRSPPSLVHRVKVDLGEFSKLNVSRLPFTLTWTTPELFLTQSATELHVMRIALFRDTKSCIQMAPKHNIVVPKNRTFLPDTTDERDVHFVPSADGKRGYVVVGSKSRLGTLKGVTALNHSSYPLLMVPMEASMGSGANKREIIAPMIGCFLREEDLGGWVRHNDVLVKKGEGVGKFSRRREKFDPVQDCEVEPYLQYV